MKLKPNKLYKELMNHKVDPLKRLARLTNPYPTCQNERGRRPKFIKIRDEKGDITTNTNKIQNIIKEYFENLYSSKLENIDRKNKFLDACNQPKLNQDDINHLNSPISCSKLVTVIMSLSTKKSPGLDEFTAEHYQSFKEEQTPILLKLFQETERKGTLTNSFYEASITLILKPNKNVTRKEN
jgi:hypothetical protein